MTRTALLACSLAVLGIGCASASNGGGDDGTGGQAGGKVSGLFGGGGKTGATGGTSATGGTGGTSLHTGGTSSGPPDGLVTNLKNPKLSESGQGQASGLKLAALNVQLQTTPSSTFGQLFARLYNDGTKLACLTSAVFTFKSKGSTVWSVDGYADAEPYDQGTKSTTPCLAPGAYGALYTNDDVFFSDTSSIDEVVVQYSGLSATSSAKSLGSTVKLSSLETLPDLADDTTGVKGHATVSSTLYNLSLNMFPLSPQGLPLGSLHAFHLDGLSAGQGFDFETLLGVDGSFADVAIYPTFITGTSSSSLVGPSLPSTERELARAAHEEAITARLAAHRAALSLARP